MISNVPYCILPPYEPLTTHQKLRLFLLLICLGSRLATYSANVILKTRKSTIIADLGPLRSTKEKCVSPNPSLRSMDSIVPYDHCACTDLSYEILLLK